MDPAYVAPIATVLVAVVGAIAAYLTRRDERAEALKEVELMERLHALAGVSAELQMASNALTRRLEGWERRWENQLYRVGGWLLFGSVVAIGLIQAIYVWAFGPEPGFSDSAKSILGQAFILSALIALLGLIALTFATIADAFLQVGHFLLARKRRKAAVAALRTDDHYEI